MFEKQGALRSPDVRRWADWSCLERFVAPREEETKTTQMPLEHGGAVSWTPLFTLSPNHVSYSCGSSWTPTATCRMVGDANTLLSHRKGRTMRRLIFATCLSLTLASGFGWTTFGPGSPVAHAAPACSKVNLCLSIQSDGNSWWIVIGGQHLQSGTYVPYSYSAGSGGGFGAVLISANNGSLNTTVSGGVCPAGLVNATASATTAKGASVSATASTAPC